jgi:hypothetical protein
VRVVLGGQGCTPSIFLSHILPPQAIELLHGALAQVMLQPAGDTGWAGRLPVRWRHCKHAARECCQGQKLRHTRGTPCMWVTHQQPRAGQPMCKGSTNPFPMSTIEQRAAVHLSSCSSAQITCQQRSEAEWEGRTPGGGQNLGCLPDVRGKGAGPLLFRARLASDPLPGRLLEELLPLQEALRYVRCSQQPLRLGIDNARAGPLLRLRLSPPAPPAPQACCRLLMRA